MFLLRNITSGLRSLFRKERVDRELDEELGAYLEMEAAEKMRQGVSRKDALREVHPYDLRLASSFPPLPSPNRRPAPHPTPGRPAPCGTAIGARSLCFVTRT